jgi:hypothetical protein
MRTTAGVLLLVAACGGETSAAASGADARADGPPDVVSAAETSSAIDTTAPDVAVADAVVPSFDGPLEPWDASTTECTWTNAFDIDSFQVIGQAIDACLAGDAAVMCTRGPDRLSLKGLAEGVAPVAFEYGTAPNGTHLLEGLGTLVTGDPPTVILSASGIPASVSFDVALVAFYSCEPLPFMCTAN